MHSATRCDGDCPQEKENLTAKLGVSWKGTVLYVHDCAGWVADGRPRVKRSGVTVIKRHKVTWRPKARLIRMIGDELVSSPIVAIVELIKNAYDADARTVEVRYTNEATGACIQVRDSGTGMSRDTLLNVWLIPATSAKKDTPVTEMGRRVLGEKGIGRFAAGTLGSRLELVTRRRGEEEIVAYVNWDAFADEEAYLDQVDIEWESRKPTEFLDQQPLGCDVGKGTLLRIWDLRFEWNEEFEENLKVALGRLVSPFANITDFHIYLNALGGRQEIEPVGVLAKPMYRVTGDVRSDGTYQVTMRTPEVTEDFHGGLDESRVRCGPFSIDVLAWDRDAVSLKPLATELGVDVKGIRGELDNACGVSIYRDGFRVFPYGDQGDDWLGLDLRSRLAPGFRLANNQVVGVIGIGVDANPLLVDQTNREGIRKTDAFSDLRKAVLEVLSSLETARRRYKAPPLGEVRRRKPDPLQPFRLSEVISTVRASYPSDRNLIKLVEAEEQKILKEASRYRQVQAQYARLAALGGLIDSLLHEGRRPLSLLRSEAQLGARDTAEWPTPYDGATERFNKIDVHGEVLSQNFSRLEPFATRGRGRPREVVLEDLVRNAVALFEADIGKHKIEVSLPNSRTVVTVDPAEISTVFVNLVDNAMYWLQRSNVPRKLLIKADRQTDGAVSIIFSDNGPGVAEKHRPYVFQPYYSTKPDGTGLGLALAGLVVEEYYDGSVSLIDGGPLPGATFEIVLRRRTGA